MLKLGFCITGSFCSMKDMLDVLKELNEEYEVELFITPNVENMDTRFYFRDDLIKEISAIYKGKINTTIQDAEIFGPVKKLDLVLVYPCTSNTLSKLVYGINDNAVTMLIKSSLRNKVTIVLGINTNDALGNSGKNIMTILNQKNYYLVPMYQDDYKKKPLSMICDKTRIKQTLEFAYHKTQIQPLILGYKEV